MDASLATKADTIAIKSDIKIDIAALDAKVNKLSWMLGILIALTIAMFAK